jgi:hypothetical protein
MDAVKPCVCPKSFACPTPKCACTGPDAALLLEPVDDRIDVKAWFSKLDEYLDEPFMPDGRQQPATPEARKILDE